MAEEIISENASELMQETNSILNMSVDPALLISLIGVIASIGILAIAVFRFAKAQQQHNTALKENQNAELVRQIERYEKEFFDIREKYHKSDHQIKACEHYAYMTLITAERLSYLVTNKLINKDTLQFFNFWFVDCLVFFNWLSKMKPLITENNFPNFFKVQKDIKYCSIAHPYDEHFLKFLNENQKIL